MEVSSTIATSATLSKHPAPWVVAYSKKCSEWHAKSLPHVVDANGMVVFHMPQNVDHPGLYDVVADLAAITIVDCVNESAGKLRCPECGYTESDCEQHGDHDLCGRFPFFSWEFYA